MSTVISPPILKVSLPISSSIRVTYPEIAILSPTFVFSGGSITSSPTSIFGSIQRFWSGTRLSQEVPNIHALGRLPPRSARVERKPAARQLDGPPSSSCSVRGPSKPKTSKTDAGSKERTKKLETPPQRSRRPANRVGPPLAVRGTQVAGPCLVVSRKECPYQAHTELR